MKCKKDTTKTLFGTFNTIFFLCGCLEVVCGLFLLSDSQRTLLSRLLATPEYVLPQPPFYYVALGLLVIGLASCLSSTLGCWVTYVPGYIILTIYFMLVLVVLVGECACGVVVGVWPRCVGLHSDRGAALAALQTYYAVPDYEQYTAAVDLAQYQFQCCGMTGSSDYDLSLWYQRHLGGHGAVFPPSCCTQRPTPATPASHLNPAPLDPTRCQDTHPSPQYTHLTGCLDKLEEWYRQHYVIFMLSLFIAAVFKLALLLTTVFNCVRIKRHKHEKHSYVMKSFDNRKNENIYETRMGRLSEEPITAKYIQPDNFYSPRVRNPRLFQSKPNDMI